MDTMIAVFINFMRGNYIKFLTVLLSMAVGWFLGKRRAKAEWRKKTFLHRLNLSLNMLRDGKLMIRTLAELSCAQVFLNVAATDAVIAACKKTTEKDPILPIARDDYWYFLNAVLNEVSEKFADGQFKRDMGVPVKIETYLICLTCERGEHVRAQKIRAMLVQKNVLENLPAKTPALEAENHIARWETLKFLAAEWKANPYKFLEMEVCV